MWGNNCRFHLLMAAAVLFAACSSPESEPQPHSWQLPPTFDSLPPVPDDNLLTDARIALGKRLFFDPRLSGDGMVSCATCHKPGLAFADTVAISPGVHGRMDFRNSPSLLNVAYQERLFREGGIPNLEIQVLAPFGNESEMDFNLREAVELLNREPAYPELARRAYGDTLTPLILARALATYQRSLISAGSRYDAWAMGDTLALSKAARRGANLFFSDRTQCASCHSGFLFTDQQYHNVGLYLVYEDEGRGRLTMKPGDMGKMKTPSLRNVAITPPYMHDGSVATLYEAVSHFNRGGTDHPNKDERVRSLGLSEEEVLDLCAFLETLTDTVYTSDGGAYVGR